MSSRFLLIPLKGDKEAGRSKIGPDAAFVVLSLIVVLVILDIFRKNSKSDLKKSDLKKSNLKIGIRWNPLQSIGFHWNPLESVGIR